jgi:hypothetical protein
MLGAASEKREPHEAVGAPSNAASWHREGGIVEPDRRPGLAGWLAGRMRIFGGWTCVVAFSSGRGPSTTAQLAGGAIPAACIRELRAASTDAAQPVSEPSLFLLHQSAKAVVACFGEPESGGVEAADLGEEECFRLPLIALSTISEWPTASSSGTRSDVDMSCVPFELFNGDPRYIHLVAIFADSLAQGLVVRVLGGRSHLLRPSVRCLHCSWNASRDVSSRGLKWCQEHIVMGDPEAFRFGHHVMRMSAQTWG